jgi:hypothetical protein
VDYIPAKPTQYRGVRYRSRLEASWAVFLHGWEQAENRRAPGSVGIMYEPMSNATNLRAWADLTCDPLPGYVGREPLDVAEYNPDFYLKCEPGSGRPSAMIEVKPTVPNDWYLKTLRGAGFFLASVGIEHVMMVGGFREYDWPLMYPYPFTRPEPALKYFGGPKYAHLFNRARNFRWDLYRGG